jgi:archaemetzincin
VIGWILLGRAGRVADEVMSAVESGIVEGLGAGVRRYDAIEDAELAFDPARGQYSSPLMLQMALSRCPRGSTRILLVTERDLFIPMLTFVFGQAQLGGTAAVLSVARLRQEFYDLPPDRELFRARAWKETVHEIGHTLGLTHCSDPQCVMSLACSIAQIDRKRQGLCRSCSESARQVLGSPAMPGLAMGARA